MIYNLCSLRSISILCCSHFKQAFNDKVKKFKTFRADSKATFREGNPALPALPDTREGVILSPHESQAPLTILVVINFFPATALRFKFRGSDLHAWAVSAYQKD